MIKVISGFSPKGYSEYGRRFGDTFHRYWPLEVALDVYVEQRCTLPRATQIDLGDVDGVLDFFRRHAADPAANGKKQNAMWRPKHIRDGYNYRFDAVKFCRQCFIPRHAISKLADGDIMVWLDGDVVTFDNVPADLVTRLLGDDDMIYLGRKHAHTELGFWAVRVNASSRSFCDAMADLFATDAIFALPEWHSAYAFDCVRLTSKLKARNLTPEGTGHVWFQCEIGQYTDHCKGARKSLGYSPERKRA
jgi:hypothetical protein